MRVLRRNNAPLMRVKGTLATFNRAGAELVCRDDAKEQFLLLVRTEDKGLCIKPLEVEGLVEVVRLHDYRNKEHFGPSRIHIGRPLASALRNGIFSLHRRGDETLVLRTNLDTTAKPNVKQGKAVQD